MVRQQPVSAEGNKSSTTAAAGRLEATGWRLLGPEGGAVFGLAVDPMRSDTVYAATYDSVFKTTDGGKHWRLSAANLGAGVVLALAQGNPEVLYVGNSTGSSGRGQ